MSRRHRLIGDLLMGAAMADQHLDGRELATVKRLLAEAMKKSSIPSFLERQLDNFDPERFDMAQVVKDLRLKDDAEKRNVLELIAKVHDSDELWDLDEDAYLRAVASELGMAEDSYADLTVQELDIGEIGAVLLPPPLPK